MQTITAEDLRVLARLSGLDLTDEELQPLVSQFAPLRGYAELLEAMDLDGEPAFSFQWPRSAP